MIAFFASTPMHIIRAVQMHMRFEEFKDEIDLFLPKNNFAEFDKVVRNLKKTGLFHKVYVYDSGDWDKMKKGSTLWLFGSKNKYKDFFRSHDYDLIASCNITNVLVSLCYHMQKKKGIRLRYIGIEDGPSVMDMRMPQKAKDIHWWCRMADMDTPFYCMDKYYLSASDYFKGKIDNPVVYLPGIDTDDTELIEMLNFVFDYVEDKDITNAKILIMEECFYNDGFFTPEAENKDYKLYKEILDRYDGIKILVKMHPRTKHNRFEGNGFVVMKNASIPWQMHLLNLNTDMISEKIMIAVSSSTLQSNKLFMDIETRCICLAKYFRHDILVDNIEFIDDSLIKKLEWIKSLYRDTNRFLMPSSPEEMFGELDNWINDDR